MVHYICFIFKSWSTSCYGAGRLVYTGQPGTCAHNQALLGTCAVHSVCARQVHQSPLLPPDWMLSVQNREHSLHLSAVCRGQESCGSGCEADVSWTLHSRVLSPHSHLKSHDGFCEKKKILSVFTTLVIFLFYIWKGNFFDTLKTIQGNFFKNAETVSSWLKMQIY